jgi:hypothetical protein
MDINKFEGIREYHDGNPVVDYCNVIPLGDKCVDRFGEININTFSSTSNNYISFTPGIHFITSNNQLIVFTNDLQFANQWYWCPLSNLYNQVNVEMSSFSVTGHIPFKPILFTESTIKPGNVLISIGDRIIYVNGELTAVGYLGMPNDPVGTTTNQPNSRLSFVITSLEWYDNRLLFVDKSLNTLWVSCSDPMQFVRNGPNTRWETDPVTHQYTGVDNLWTDWYHSTLTADNINLIKVFNSAIYIFKEYNIEVWSRTGNDDNPIEINQSQSKQVGGIAATICNDSLYFIAQDKTNNKFLGAIDNSGQVKRISNNEIERRIPNMSRLEVVTLREKTFVVVYDELNMPTSGFAVGAEGIWWRWDVPDDDIGFGGIIGPLLYSKSGTLLKMDPTTRRYNVNQYMHRAIRDFMTDVPGRMILRSVQVVMDAGRILPPSRNTLPIAHLRISNNFGHTWSRHYEAKLGTGGQNDKVVVFRNLGSGNNFTLEFSVNENVVLQVYKFRVELQ